MEFEVGFHDGAYQGGLDSHVPFISRKTLSGNRPMMIFMGIRVEHGWNICLPAFGLGGLWVTFGWGPIRILSVFAMCTRASPQAGGFQSGHGESGITVWRYAHAVPVLCRNTRHVPLSCPTDSSRYFGPCPQSPRAPCPQEENSRSTWASNVYVSSRTARDHGRSEFGLISNDAQFTVTDVEDSPEGAPRQKVVVRQGLDGDGPEVATIYVPKRGSNKAKLPPDGFGPLRYTVGVGQWETDGRRGALERAED